MESSQSHPARLLGPGGCPKTKVNKKQPPPCPPPRIQEQLLSERPPLPPTHSAIQSKKKFPDPPSFVDRIPSGDAFEDMERMEAHAIATAKLFVSEKNQHPQKRLEAFTLPRNTSFEKKGPKKPPLKNKSLLKVQKKGSRIGTMQKFSSSGSLPIPANLGEKGKEKKEGDGEGEKGEGGVKEVEKVAKKGGRIQKLQRGYSVPDMSCLSWANVDFVISDLTASPLPQIPSEISKPKKTTSKPITITPPPSSSSSATSPPTSPASSVPSVIPPSLLPSRSRGVTEPPPMVKGSVSFQANLSEQQEEDDKEPLFNLIYSFMGTPEDDPTKKKIQVKSTKIKRIRTLVGIAELFVSEDEAGVVGGTKQNLFRMLFSEEYSESYVTNFLYGYRNIATSQEFFDYLSDRFFNAHVDTEIGYEEIKEGASIKEVLATIDNNISTLKQMNSSNFIDVDNAKKLCDFIVRDLKAAMKAYADDRLVSSNLEDRITVVLLEKKVLKKTVSVDVKSLQMAEIKERAIDVMELWIRKHYYDIKSSYDKNEEKDEQTLKEKLIAFFEELLLDDHFSNRGLQLQIMMQEIDLLRRLHRRNITFLSEESPKRSPISPVSSPPVSPSARVRTLSFGSKQMRKSSAPPVPTSPLSSSSSSSNIPALTKFVNPHAELTNQMLVKLWNSKLPTSRKVKGKKYKCFTGKELSDWVRSEISCDEALAFEVCSLLVRKSLLRVGEKDRRFLAEEKSLYAFNSETQSMLKEMGDKKKLSKAALERNPKSLLEIHPLELGQQLALLEAEIFQKITPLELMNQAWSSQLTRYLCPNVTSLVERFNAVSYWVATELIEPKLPKVRLATLKRLIVLGELMRTMRCYNIMMEIVIGLSLGPVSRLTQLWDSLPEKHRETFDSLLAFSSAGGNYRTYRAALKSQSPPGLPYVAVYFRDLTFIADGNPKYLDDEKTVLNFERIEMEAAVFEEIQHYQQVPFRYTPNAAVQNYLTACLTKFLSEKELWDRSDSVKKNAKAKRMEKRKSYGSLKDISRRHARALSMLRDTKLDKELEEAAKEEAAAAAGDGEGEAGGEKKTS